MDYIPRGVRFGPLVGEYRKPDIAEATVSPAEASGAGEAASNAHINSGITSTQLISDNIWKVFSSSGSILVKMIDAKNDKKSNWMKFVKPAKSKETQNLVACQVCCAFLTDQKVKRVLKLRCLNYVWIVSYL